MKTIIPVILLLASVCSGAEWDAFKLTIGKAELGEGYYDMPWTVKEAIEGGKWIKIDEDKTLNVEVFSQPEDPRVLLLFDKKGNIAGVRMSLIKEDIKKKAEEGGHTFDLDYDKNSLYEKAKYFGKDLWFTSVLFVSPKILAAGGRDKILKKETDDIIESVWFKPEGKWIEISKDECNVGDIFDGPTCLEYGKHYLHKGSEDCKLRKPFMAVYDQGKLSGVALVGYGSYTKNPKTKFYFEDISTIKLKDTKPACVKDYIEKYGITLMHVILKKTTPQLKCTGIEWKNLKC